MLASVSGFQMLRFGQFWLIFEITGSPLSLGWIGLANGVPAIVLNLFGGVAADRIDQRRMVMISQSIIAMLIFFLATITTPVEAIHGEIALATVFTNLNDVNKQRIKNFRESFQRFS